MINDELIKQMDRAGVCQQETDDRLKIINDVHRLLDRLGVPKGVAVWRHITGLEKIIADTGIHAWQRRVGEWSVKTFGSSEGARGTLGHLLEEAQELYDAETLEHQAEELADVVMLALGFAHRRGIDLQAALERKFAILQERKWDKPDANGVVHHVKEPRLLTDAMLDKGD